MKQIQCIQEQILLINLQTGRQSIARHRDIRPAQKRTSTTIIKKQMADVFLKKNPIGWLTEPPDAN